MTAPTPWPLRARRTASILNSSVYRSGLKHLDSPVSLIAAGELGPVFRHSSDGWHSLLDIAARSGLAFGTIAAAAAGIPKAGLMRKRLVTRRRPSRA